MHPFLDSGGKSMIMTNVCLPKHGIIPVGYVIVSDLFGCEIGIDAASLEWHHALIDITDHAQAEFARGYSCVQAASLSNKSVSMLEQETNRQ